MENKFSKFGMGIFALVLAVFGIFVCWSCQNETNVDENDERSKGEIEVNSKGEIVESPEGDELSNSLVGTKWKLAGIVDTKTNIIKELEPKNCVECYTLTFETKSTFSTISSANDLRGDYMIDFATNGFQITIFGGTKVGECCDGDLYSRPFWKMAIQSFSFQENELRLYYDDNYLLFKSKKQSEVVENPKGEVEIPNVIEDCKFDNPLTDLPWLKELVERAEKNAESGFMRHARIYQCAYESGIGFLLEMCVGCPDAGYSFRNCKGEVLCGGGGYSGEDNCSEFNIDFENRKLIWEINLI